MGVACSYCGYIGHSTLLLLAGATHPDTCLCACGGATAERAAAHSRHRRRRRPPLAPRATPRASLDAATMDPTTRRWPNLLILGNPKSGSTFLFSCLRAGPFDPNLLYGSQSQAWRQARGYVLTTLGTKKEFNFWGGPGFAWGPDWYAGAPAPLSAWEWTGRSVEGRRQRRGENGNGEPNAMVDELCRVAEMANQTLAKRRRRARLACRRFPIECIDGAPLVRPGCALGRPLPSRRRCGRPKLPACEAPKVRMSHAWPPLADLSPSALTVDPSINTFMSAPAAPDQLREHFGTSAAASLKFVVILREPIARAQSSARMMREWKWDKSPNVSSALLKDLERFGHCCAAITPPSNALDLDGAKGFEGAGSHWRRAASELPRLSDRPLRRFRECLARGQPLNHVRGSVYAAAVLGWLSAGFSASQFLWLETEGMREMGPVQLLTTFAAFAGLPTQHLSRLPDDVRAACESRRGGGATARGAPAAREVGRAPLDDRMAVHPQRALPTGVASQLREAVAPFNELLRTLLNDLDAAGTLRTVRWLQHA